MRLTPATIALGSIMLLGVIVLIVNALAAHGMIPALPFLPAATTPKDKEIAWVLAVIGVSEFPAIYLVMRKAETEAKALTMLAMFTLATWVYFAIQFFI